MKHRSMSVNGSFYPSQIDEIERMIEHFNTLAPKETKNESIPIKAIIVPHAGWIYSGYTANLAFNMLHKQHPKRFIVIGPSHRVGFEGISVSEMDYYETPLGNIDIDQEIVNDIKNRFSLECYPAAHHEHSTEVQMPFIRHYYPQSKIVELVYAYTTPVAVIPIIQYALSLEDTVVVISTDLSHFHPLDVAQRVDAFCLEAIKTKNTEYLERGCEACGIIGVDAMLSTANALNLNSHILDYRTSADASGDSSRVVGYTSAIFT